jgi:hypothetical protein
MTLGGVALARANLGLAGMGGPDGILYALEAADLNLEGTELVTLSASPSTAITRAFHQLRAVFESHPQTVVTYG